MREALLGATYDRAHWLALVLDERFARRGAYFIPEGALDWSRRRRALPARARRRVGPRRVAPRRRAVRPLPRLRRARSWPIISLGEPVTGRRPSDTELDFLVAVGATPRCALEHGHRTAGGRAATARRSRQLLAVSSKLAEKDSIESVLEAVCDGVMRALGFHKVVIELDRPRDRHAATARAASAGRRGQEPDWRCPPRRIEPLLDPAFEIGGCYLLPERTRARERAPLYADSVSELNGRGPLAWDRHRLFVPLRDRTGDDRRAHLGRRSRGPPAAVAGAARGARACSPTRRRWRSSPPASSSSCASWPTRTRSRGCPTAARSCATSSPRSSARAATGTRSRSCSCDVDDFKHINDTHGHPGGDRALCEVGARLRAGLRAGDAAFRIGGDEFALLLPETTAEQAAVVAARVAAPHRASPARG